MLGDFVLQLRHMSLRWTNGKRHLQTMWTRLKRRQPPSNGPVERGTSMRRRSRIFPSFKESTGKRHYDWRLLRRLTRVLAASDRWRSGDDLQRHPAVDWAKRFLQERIRQPGNNSRTFSDAIKKNGDQQSRPVFALIGTRWYPTCADSPSSPSVRLYFRLSAPRDPGKRQVPAYRRSGTREGARRINPYPTSGSGCAVQSLRRILMETLF